MFSTNVFFVGRTFASASNPYLRTAMAPAPRTYTLKMTPEHSASKIIQHFEPRHLNLATKSMEMDDADDMDDGFQTRNSF
jgi:hypothetical protein